MLELIQITPDNAIAFTHLIKEDVYLYVADPATVSIGIVDDKMPVAALLVRAADDGSSEILSICVDHEYRRQGLATELLIRAADYLTQDMEVNRLNCSFTLRDGDDSFLGYLKYLEFEINEVPGGCYVTTFGELRQLKELAGPTGSCVPFSELTTIQKKQLKDGAMDVSDLLENDSIEPDMSAFLLEGNVIRSCLIFTKDEEDPDAYTIAWSRNTGSPADMLYLLRYALKASTAADEVKLYVPVLNERSERLTVGILGDKGRKIETSYEAKLSLFTGEEEQPVA